MDSHALRDKLVDLPIPEVRWFDEIGSTNDVALQWVIDGAQEGCMAAADSQTRGRGRLGRHWVTRPGAALAFSVIFKPGPQEIDRIALFSPLGAVAICEALDRLYGLRPEIKWPNDVLLQGRKVAGILVEAAWTGEHLDGIVIGIGVNVASSAVPPDNEVLYPAISVEQVVGRAIDRFALLHDILTALFQWRSRLQAKEFFTAWESRLAFQNQWVKLTEGTPNPTAEEGITGQIIGISPSGDLQLRLESGDVRSVSVGDVRLRPVEK